MLVRSFHYPFIAYKILEGTLANIAMYAGKRLEHILKIGEIVRSPKLTLLCRSS
jgi:hypothetical protein